MKGPRSPEWRQPFGYFCYTLRAYSNAKCQRHLFDEAHRSWSGDYPAQTFHFLADPVFVQAAWDSAAHPLRQFRSGSISGRHPTAIFDKGD
jgi:hypothetical protein